MHKNIKFQSIDILSVPLFLSNIDKNIDKKSGKERTAKNIDKKSGPIKISIKRADQKSRPLFLAIFRYFFP